MSLPTPYHLQYFGRRCGRTCLALLGDENTPKPHQASLRLKNCGQLVTWKGLWPFLDRIHVSVAHIPAAPPAGIWI